ncbi:MAG TPA: ATP-binding protein [Candidatus Saccharimonadia bacterium]|nr:ATP-binding protein [Candidatus Saccharimonadia bacterium]
MESLFGKKMEDLEFQDVVDFCDKQYKEGIFLDYKQDLSGKKSLVKTICSFANTVGGWLIIGVEDESDKPKPPYNGIEYNPQIASAIPNMIVDSVWPYIRPIVQVCGPNADNKAFIAVYVPESDEAPHWTADKSHLYVRRSDRSDSTDWERYATAHEWEWLRNKRLKAEDQRERSGSTLQAIYARLHNREYPIVAGGGTTANDGRMRVFVSPFFPSTQLFSGAEAYNALYDQRVNTASDGAFPTYLPSRMIFDEGAYTHGVERLTSTTHESFLGLENFGGILANKDILRSGGHGERHIIFHEFMNRLEDTLEFAANVYKSKNYLGLACLEVGISVPVDSRIVFRGAIGSGLNSTEKVNVRGSFEASLRLDNEELSSKPKRYELMKEIATSLLHSYGYAEIPGGTIEEAFQRQ